MAIISNHKFWFLFLISSVLSAEFRAKVPVGKPITYTVGYRKTCGMGTNWSSTMVFDDYSHQYAVVTYSDYAEDIHDFIKEYPTVTIETSGYAYSDETVGDVGTGHFGSVVFNTEHFKNRDYVEELIVECDSNAFWWHVVMEVGFGFKYEENKFYLRPFVHGWVYSGGAVWRYIHYELDVTTITFNPRAKKEYVEFSSQEPIAPIYPLSIHCNLSSSWSATEKCDDCTKSYPILDYTKYATTIDDFIGEHPLVSIETSGNIYKSEASFGWKCADRFGKLTFNTTNFNNTEYYNEVICSYNESHFNYDVGVEIGLGFKKVENEFYLRLLINGWIYSAGANVRKLDIAFNVTNIDFSLHPEEKYSYNLVS